MKKKFQRKNERADKLKLFINSIRHTRDTCEEESEQTDCSITQRNINYHLTYYLHIVRYILLLAKQHTLTPDTAYLALTILDDLYYQDQSFNKYQFYTQTNWWKVLAMGILLISSKLNDIYNVTVTELILLCPHVTKFQIVMAEQMLVDALDYIFPQQTPYTIFYEHSQTSNVSMKAYCSLFEKVLKSEITESINCNIIAKAVVFHYNSKTCIGENQKMKERIKKINELIKKLI